MAFYDIDLTTRVGALGAAQQGALGAFAFAGMGVLGIVIFGAVPGFSTAEGIAIAIGGGFEAVVGLIAGLRLRAGKGVWWGGFAAALLLAEIIGKLIALSIGGLLLSGVVLIVLVQGIRGAWALRRGTGFEDDQVDLFA